MGSNSAADSYKTQQIMTALPEELTLLLYSGAIRFVNESIEFLERGNRLESHNSNLRTQDIVNEFMNTLDMKYELSKRLLSLYEYILRCLIQGNIKKDKEKLLEARSLLFELREVWVAAMKDKSSIRVDDCMQDNMVKKFWLEYRSLTKKMVKFLEKQDMELFYEVLNQRKKLKVMIDNTGNEDFRNSGEGQRLFFEIESDSNLIANMLQSQQKVGKNHQQFSSAYKNEIGASISSRSWKR